MLRSMKNYRWLDLSTKSSQETHKESLSFLQSLNSICGTRVSQSTIGLLLKEQINSDK